ncbi:phosphoenolpyruvate--protein phosphotransferase [Spirochaeta lutea]|uniref:phosphoenolpyruvate--protein phosphotransferase n=1 Tax=Spirochaeta lutea TaxID=1480694 RepID=UPI0006902463|nr:phosphoenolpyruvate--protein phosphotransferase [Spirochaeta lutea]
MSIEILSPGIAKGHIKRLAQVAMDFPRTVSKDRVQDELERFRVGRSRAMDTLRGIIEKTAREIGPEEAEIFEGHLELMESDDLSQEVEQYIQGQLMSSEAAVDRFAQENAADMEALEDEYFRQRGQDLRDIGVQLIRAIQDSDAAGSQDPETGTAPRENDGCSGSTEESPGCILVAEELSPSQTASLDFSAVRGLILARGGKNSHAAIIARAQELPALVVTDVGTFESLQEGTLIYVDANQGALLTHPDKNQQARLDALISQEQELRAKAAQAVELPSRTADGQHLGIFANVGVPGDIRTAGENRADGIGLFRTEFLFMQSGAAPTQADQARVYRQAVQTLDGKPVIIRLLDTGADKPLPYLELPTEENPFLGIRGIRLLLDHEDYLRTQLRALIEASVSGTVHVMIPMVAGLESIRRVKALLFQEKQDWAEDIRLGVMVETPASVILIEDILREVDFISIGTNDLTQYTLAADRGNPALARYYDELHPAVLRSIAKVVTAARAQGKLNGICGELAGNLLALPFFVGISVGELSCAPKHIGAMRLLLSAIDSTQAAQLSRRILALSSPQEVRQELEAFRETVRVP